MTNVWLKNKAVVWTLIVVFLFTSVFNTSTVFANTEAGSTPAAVSATNPDGESTTDSIGIAECFNYIHVFNYTDGYDSIGADLDQMTENGELEILIPSDYPGTEMTLGVYASEGFGLWSEDGEDEFGDYKEFSLEDLTAGGSITIAFRIGGIDTDEYKLCRVTVSATKNPYVEGIKVNNIKFADDFDGVAELSEDNVFETVAVDLDIAEDDGSSEYLELEFTHVDQNWNRSVQLYRDEDGEFQNTFDITRNNFDLEGTYQLKRIVNDNYKKVENLSESPLKFDVVHNFSDNEAPVINDVFFTVDGVKCEEPGFKITEGQSVEVWIEVSDESGFEGGSVTCYTKQEDGAGGAESEFVLDEDSGLYYANVTMNWEESAEWYLDNIYVYDKYGCSATYTKVGDKPLNQMYFYHGIDAQPKEWTYTVELSVPGDYKEYEVTTTRLTSFEDMGIEFSSPIHVDNVEFMGWRIGYNEDSELITSPDQVFAIDSGSLRISPVYDKSIARINAYYCNVNDEWVEEYVYVSIEEGTTYGELEQQLKDMDCLSELNHAPDRFLEDWYFYIDGADDDTVITEPFAYVYAEADYRYIELVERTLYANGGVFSDGSTEKTVTIDANEEEHMAKLEKPVREGFAFGGWTDSDGCYVSSVWGGCDEGLHARWISETDASIRYGEIQFTTEKSFEDGYDYRDIWCDDGDTISRVTLPFDVNPDCVRLKVKKQDGSTVYEPIQLEAEGVTEYVYESIAADGITTQTYTVIVTLEEPPTGLYRMGLNYRAYDEWSFDNFEFEGTTATVTVPYGVEPDSEIYFSGYDLDGNWISSERVVMGDADEVTITYTSQVNGAVYTLNVVREEPNGNTFSDFWIRVYNGEDYGDYWIYSEDFNEANEGTVGLPKGTITEDATLYLYAEPYWKSTSDLPYDEDYEGYRKMLVPDEEGNYITDVTITAENGDTRTYTINVVEGLVEDEATDPDGDEVSNETGCSITIGLPDGSSYWGDSDEAATEDGVVITVPYGTINDAFLRVQPYNSKADVDEDMELIEGEWSNYYKRELTPDENGEIYTTFTVTAENGDTKTYRVKVVERSGDEIEFAYMDASVWDGKTYGEDSEGEQYKQVTYMYVNLEEAAEEEGTTLRVPYYYNEEYGIVLNAAVEAGDISGLNFDEPYYLDDDGKLTLEFTVTSPNGKKTQNYKINFVKDTEGATTEISRLQYCWQWNDFDTDEYRCVKVDIDEEAAKSEDGYNIFVPVEMEDKYYDFWIAADSDNYSRFETISAYEWNKGQTQYSFGRISHYFNIPEETKTWEFTVTSPDESTTEHYKFNIIPISIPDCAEHTYGDWDDRGDREVRYCSVCGIEDVKFSMDEHEHSATGDWQHTDIEHWQLCECGQMLNAGDHDYDEHISKEPTCSEPGMATYDCQCGYSYTAEIPVTDHQYTITAVEPTCTEPGYLIYTCDCGDSYTDDYVSSLGHDPVMMPIQEATCYQDGYEGGVECIRCNEILEEPIWTPMIPCDYTGPWEVEEYPTCVSEGKEFQSCHMCANRIYQSIPATGVHTEASELGYEPTCTEPGMTDQIYCEICKEVLEWAQEIPAIGEHDWGEWILVGESETPGYLDYERECNRCWETEAKTEADPDYDEHVHDFNGEWGSTGVDGHWRYCECGERSEKEPHEFSGEPVYPTCTELGYVIYTCECGYVDKDDFVSPTGHDMTFVEDKAPTCDGEGAYQHYFCNNCEGYFLDEAGEEQITREKAVIPALGHEWGDWTQIGENETTGKMDYERICNSCGDKEAKSEDIQKYTYNVSFNIYEDYEEFEVTTSEWTSFDDMGIDIPEPVSAIGAEFVGWKMYDGTIIKSNDQKFQVEGFSYSFEPAYDKQIARVYINYCDGADKWTEDYIYFGIEEGTTYGQFRDMVIEGKYLDEIEHDESQVFKGWEFFMYHEDDEVITEDPAYIDAHAQYHQHDYYGEYTEPTCTEQGYMTYTCECGDSYTDEYEDPWGHDMSHYDAVEPDCEDEGQIEHYYCYRCDEYFLDEEGLESTSYDEIIIEPTDHIFGDELAYDGVEHWQVCSLCEGVYNVEEHEYTEEIIEPTCTSEGYTIYTCDCGYTYDGDYVDTTDHDFSEGWIYDDANHWLACGECEECFNTEAHDWGYWEVVSSYDDYIEYERACRICDAVDFKTEEEPEDPGEEHQCTPAGDWVYDNDYHWHVCDCLEILDMEEHQIVMTEEIEATCIDQGEKIFECETCDYSYSEYTDTVDHSWGEWIFIDSCDGDFEYERYCEICEEYDYKIEHVSHPEVVKLSYFKGDEEKYLSVELDDDFVSSVEIPYSYNREIGVVLEWSDNDGSKNYDAVIWNEDDTGVVEIESVNGYSYTINVTVAEAASNTDCSLSLGNGNGNSFPIDAEAAGSDEGATMVLPEGALDGLFLRVATYENGYVEGMEYVIGDYSSYYKMSLTPDKNGEINIEFDVIAENGEDSQTYKIKVMEEQKAPAEHEHNYFASVTNPTCLEKGYTTYTCTCGDSYVDDYKDATGHQNTKTIEGKEPTCTATGLTDSEICLDCNLTLEPQQVIKAQGHDWDEDWTIDDDATCTAAGKQHKDCSRCDEKQNGTIPATGHSYDEDVTDPTCTEGGYTTYTCGECDHSYVGDKTGAAGHEWSEWFEEDADCMGTYYSRMCDNCGDEEAKTEPGEGHDYETFTKVISRASNKSAGKIATYQYCNNCEDEDEAERISTDAIPKAAAVKMSATALTYTGKKAIPTLTVKDVNGNKLEKGTDYKVTIKTSAGKTVSAPKAVGKYKITITYMGNYKGSVYKNYTINPAGTKLGKLTGGKKQITVKWTKKTAQVTGYQIRYSTKQNMSNAKTVLVTKTKTTSKVIKKLTAKKKYYVQIRTYKKINNKKYYSEWSAKKNVKTK